MLTGPILFYIFDQARRDNLIWSNKKYVAHPIYSKHDYGVKLFRRWYSQFYSDHELNNSVSGSTEDNSIE